MVEFYDYGNLGLGYVVDPESDYEEKTVIIVGKQMVKCNPRPVVIYVTGGKIDETYDKLEELKAYCSKNKVVYICPKSTDIDELGKTCKYVIKNGKTLNVKVDELSIKGDSENISVAEELVDYMLDEYDAEVPEADIFEL